MAHIIEARGLPGLDTNNMSDPLAIVSIGPNTALSRKTECKYGTVNALWERKFVFENVRLTEEEFDREKLLFHVYDRNVWGKNELIGKLLLVLFVHIYIRIMVWFPSLV